MSNGTTRRPRRIIVLRGDRRRQAWRMTSPVRRLLEIVTVYHAVRLSWDLADWNWSATTTRPGLRALFAGDLSRASERRPHPSTRAWRRPTHPLRVAESWELKDIRCARDQARKGVSFPRSRRRPHASSWRRRDLQLQPARQQPQEDRHLLAHSTRSMRRQELVVFTSGIQRRVGLPLRRGHYSFSMPKEVADARRGNWENLNGTGRSS